MEARLPSQRHRCICGVVYFNVYAHAEACHHPRGPRPELDVEQIVCGDCGLMFTDPCGLRRHKCFGPPDAFALGDLSEKRSA